MPSAATAYQALSNYQAPNAQDVVNQAYTQTGVQADQQRVSDLQNATAGLQSSINAVDPNVTGRTSGTFTTEAQRGALVTAEQKPLQSSLASENTALTNANSTAQSAKSDADTLATAMLSSDQQTYQKLLDQYNAAAAYEKQQQDSQYQQQQLQQTNADEAEKIREYNNPQAAPMSAADLTYEQNAQTSQEEQTAWTTLNGALSKVTGSDGYVSPNDYNAAKREWAAAGLPTATFDAFAAGYRNPGNKFYGVTQPNATVIAQY